MACKTYLIRYGYEDTFRAFNLAASVVRHTDIAQEDGSDEFELHQRKNIIEVLFTAIVNS